MGAVIFDEFHERSLNADLGLALCLESAGALRDDLILLVAMSATLDAAPVAADDGRRADGSPREGRSIPGRNRIWLDRPIAQRRRLEHATADLVCRRVAETEGGVLVFLPGEGEIRRVESAAEVPNCLAGPAQLAARCLARWIFARRSGPRSPRRPDGAQSGAGHVDRRNLADHSRTFRVVVDGGRARRARFDPGQRHVAAGDRTRDPRRSHPARRPCRAGWRQGARATGSGPAARRALCRLFRPAEIEAADLSGLALELALWGAAPEDCRLSAPPNPGALCRGPGGCLKHAGRAWTLRAASPAHGRRAGGLPLHPRLAHMLTEAGPDAAPLAALLADRDPLSRGAPVDLTLRLSALRDLRAYTDRHPYQANRAAVERIRQEAKRLAKAPGQKRARKRMA